MKNHKKDCQCGMCKAIRGETKGSNNPNFGNHYSNEIRKKMRENHADFSGKNNPRAGENKYNITKQLLIKEYIKTKKSMSQIAKEIECNHVTIHNYLKKYNIPIRTKSEAFKGIKKNPFTKKHKRNISLAKGGSGVSYENTEYGAEFDNALKEQIRFRDGYKCQVCGCSQLENGRQLDVHHIDYDKKNNKLNNLIALCQKCHPKTNGNRNHWTKYFKSKIDKIKI